MIVMVEANCRLQNYLNSRRWRSTCGFVKLPKIGLSTPTDDIVFAKERR